MSEKEKYPHITAALESDDSFALLVFETEDIGGGFVARMGDPHADMDGMHPHEYNDVAEECGATVAQALDAVEVKLSQIAEAITIYRKPK